MARGSGQLALDACAGLGAGTVSHEEALRTKAVRWIRGQQGLLGFAHRADDLIGDIRWRLRRKDLLTHGIGPAIPRFDGTIVFWAPESDITPHFTAMALVAGAVRDADGQPGVVR